MSPHFPMCLLLGFHRIVVILFLVVGTQCESLCYSYLLPHSLPPKVESKPLSEALEEESGNKNSVLSSLLHLGSQLLLDSKCSESLCSKFFSRRAPYGGGQAGGLLAVQMSLWPCG